MRKAKIICTMGPASREEPTLSRLVEAGMDVARLNFSHGTHEDHARAIVAVRKAAENAGRPVALLLDLQGPKIRVGKIEGGKGKTSLVGHCHQSLHGVDASLAEEVG